MTDEKRILSQAEIQDIADQAAGKAVKSMLITLGIDANNPLSVQADMRFARSLRETCENAGKKVVLVVVGIIVVGICTLIGASIWPGAGP